MSKNVIRFEVADTQRTKDHIYATAIVNKTNGRESTILTANVYGVTTAESRDMAERIAELLNEHGA